MEEFKKRHRCLGYLKNILKNHPPTVVFSMTTGALGKLAFSSTRLLRVTGVIQAVLSPQNVSLLLFGSSAISLQKSKVNRLSSKTVVLHAMCISTALGIQMVVFWGHLTSRDQERVALFETRLISFMWAPMNRHHNTRLSINTCI